MYCGVLKSNTVPVPAVLEAPRVNPYPCTTLAHSHCSKETYSLGYVMLIMWPVKSKAHYLIIHLKFDEADNFYQNHDNHDHCYNYTTTETQTTSPSPEPVLKNSSTNNVPSPAGQPCSYSPATTCASISSYASHLDDLKMPLHNEKINGFFVVLTGQVPGIFFSRWVI